MKARAVIFDVYDTLLEVSPPPATAPAGWERLWTANFSSAPRLTLAGFSAACGEIIAREHGLARARGIPFPEICWPSVAAKVMPELTGLSPERRDEFLFQQSKLWHTVRLAAGVPTVLRTLRQEGCLLGIASNAQAYTMRELQEALAAHGLGVDLFERNLCFWSFAHGFSKPDPHVFRILTARLEARGLRPVELLMIGDHPDHDIAPAKAHGWQAWQIGAQADGDWAAFLGWWRKSQPEVPK